MPPCTGSRVNTNYKRVAAWGGCQCWTGNPRIFETTLSSHCCSQSLNHSVMTHASKRIGTSWTVSHMGYNSESSLGRNDSPLGCFYLALTFRYYFVRRKHENMSPCTDSRANTNYKRVAAWGGCQCWTGNPRIFETPLAPHCCSQRLNHSAMTHSSKRIGTSWTVSHIGYNSESILGRNDSPQTVVFVISFGRK